MQSTRGPSLDTDRPIITGAVIASEGIRRSTLSPASTDALQGGDLGNLADSIAASRQRFSQRSLLNIEPGEVDMFCRRGSDQENTIESKEEKLTFSVAICTSQPAREF